VAAEDRTPPPPPRGAGQAGAAPQPGAGNDPSMEDILASIRRILNEEEGAPSPAAPTGGPQLPPAENPAGPTPPPPADDALTLSEDMLVPERDTGPAGPQPPPGGSGATPPRAEPPRAEPATPATPRPASPPPPPEPPSFGGGGSEGLLAPAAASAAAASVGQLLRTVAAERGSAVSRGGPTIEDLVREELRPLLKEWLDRHLPPLVERLVRAEIERLVGRAMS
jgi:uncharacterized protein